MDCCNKISLTNYNYWPIIWRFLCGCTLRHTSWHLCRNFHSRCQMWLHLGLLKLVFTHMFFFEIFAPALIKIFIASRCPLRLAFKIGVALLRRRMSVWTYTLSPNAVCCKSHQANECHYYILQQTVTTYVLSHVSTSLPAARRISQTAELPMKAAQ